MRLRKVIDDHLIMQRKSRSDFAKEIGMSKQAVGRWLNGSMHVSGEHLASLMVYLLSDEPEDTA